MERVLYVERLEKLKEEANKINKEIKALEAKKDSESKKLGKSASLSEDEVLDLRNKQTRLYSVCNQIVKLIEGQRDAGDVLSAEEEKFLSRAKGISEEALEKSKQYGSTMRGIPKRTFDDVQGLGQVKKVVESFVYMADHPGILKHYGMEGGLGLLMYGAPGTGKTMFAEAVANKMRLPLFVITPADIFNSYVGASEKAVRSIFDEMDNCEDGAVLFVDECESIFSKRGDNDESWKSSVTTELLQRMNGFDRDGSKRVLIAATNRPDKIDKAYLRYKRFSNMVHVEPPDKEALLAIIESKLKVNKSEEERIALRGVTSEWLCDRLWNNPSGRRYTGADACGIIEEACRLAIEDMIAYQTDEYLDLTEDYFEEAIARHPASVDSSVLSFYTNFKDSLNEDKDFDQFAQELNRGK
ncbi:MAG: ATP-binding protein [Bacilli bacterium]|nr:ATP-binding protein [Bacilli bacterium]